MTNSGTSIPLDQWVTLSSLSGVTYTGSATHGTDEIWLRRTTGVGPTWVGADIADPRIVPPAVTPINQSVASNQSVPLTSIFSVNGSGITQYQLWFSWPEARAPALGTVTNNGTSIPLDQPVTLNSLNGVDLYGLVHPRHRPYLAPGLQRRLETAPGQRRTSPIRALSLPW